MLLMELTLGRLERGCCPILDNLKKNCHAPHGDGRPIDLLRAGHWMILLLRGRDLPIIFGLRSLFSCRSLTESDRNQVRCAGRIHSSRVRFVDRPILWSSLICCAPILEPRQKRRQWIYGMERAQGFFLRDRAACQIIINILFHLRRKRRRRPYQLFAVHSEHEFFEHRQR